MILERTYQVSVSYPERCVNIHILIVVSLNTLKYFALSKIFNLVHEWRGMIKSKIILNQFSIRRRKSTEKWSEKRLKFDKGLTKNMCLIFKNFYLISKNFIQFLFNFFYYETRYQYSKIGFSKNSMASNFLIPKIPVIRNFRVIPGVWYVRD